MRIRIHRIALVHLLSLVFALPLGAQTVRGRVVDVQTGQPVAGFVVTLTDAQGARHEAVITRADGEFVLRGPAAGRYTLVAERSGYESVRFTHALAAGETAERRIDAVPMRLVLEPVIAQGVRRPCTVRPRNGSEAAVLWEEARKALASVDVGRQRRLYTYQARTVRRQMSLPSRQVVDSAVRVFAGQGAQPFRATAVERLAEHGYVEAERDSLTFHAPDAATLLSDVFLDGHCFSMRNGRGAQAGLVGLEFAPLRGRRLPDVRGVLWMDRRTAALRHVEYTYTALPWRGYRDDLGGRVDFEQLEDGGWIVRRWSIRMPTLWQAAPGAQPEVRGLVEQEGTVITIRPAHRGHAEASAAGVASVPPER